MKHRKYIYPPHSDIHYDGTSDSYKAGRSTPYQYCECKIGKDHDEVVQPKSFAIIRKLIKMGILPRGWFT